MRLTRENVFVDERRALHFADWPGSPEPHLEKHEILRLVRVVEAAAVAARRLDAGEASEPERASLRRAVRRGEQAKRALVEANLWSAWWYARIFSKIHGRRLGEREDLVQEGLIGLLEALEALGSRPGEAFGGYASHWMQDATRSASGGRALSRRPGAPGNWHSWRDAP